MRFLPPNITKLHLIKTVSFQKKLCCCLTGQNTDWFVFIGTFFLQMKWSLTNQSTGWTLFLERSATVQSFNHHKYNPIHLQSTGMEAGKCLTIRGWIFSELMSIRLFPYITLWNVNMFFYKTPFFYWKEEDDEDAFMLLFHQIQETQFHVSQVTFETKKYKCDCGEMTIKVLESLKKNPNFLFFFKWSLLSKPNQP